MAAYGFLISAYVYDVLAIGLIGKRGWIILILIGVALAAAWIQGPIGWCGLILGVATVLIVRRIGQWLNEGGTQVVWAVTVELVALAAGYVGDMVRWVCLILSPVREDVPEPVFHAPPEVPVPGDTAAATPQMMRWTPGWTPPAESGGTAQMPPMASMETYASVIAEVAANDRPYNESAAYVAERYKVSRSKFARDVRARREEIAA